MNVRRWPQRACERARLAWKQLLSRTTSKLRALNPWSLNPGTPAYVASAVVTAACWTLGSTRVWSIILRRPALDLVGATVTSGTVVAVSVGLTAIPLALTIMLSQMYSGHAGRLRVFLYVSEVQVSLVATVTTGVATAVIGGRFYGWLTLAWLGVIAFLSCFSILKALILLQRPDQYADAWGRFIVLRQSAITVNSPRRQQNAIAAKAAFADWGSNAIKVEQWFEHFNSGILDDYVVIPAQTTGAIDDISLPTLHRLLTILQEHEGPLSTNATITGHTVSDAKVRGPMMVICQLPGSLVKDRLETLALFRKDVLLDADYKDFAHALKKAFRIDSSERLLTIIGDLRSEARELGNQLMQGVHSNDPGPIAEFWEVCKYIVCGAAQIHDLEASEAAQQTYFDLLEALVWATDDARCLVENPAAHVDREIKDLVLSLPKNFAYAAAETGNPEVFQRCLSPLWLQCRDSLQQQPDAPDTRHYLSWYGVLSSAIQRLTEPNAAKKTGIDQAVSEAKLVLKNLSTLLLLLARQHEWHAAALVAEEISNLEPRPSMRHNDAVTLSEYPSRFRALVSLMYYGVHACLVDLAMTELPSSVPPNLVEATWPHDDFDLSRLISVYAQATAEGSADALSWGWEPEPISGVVFSPRIDEILSCGFVATVITWPEFALFQDSDTWRAAQLEKLEQAAGGFSELKRLIGTGSLVDGTLKNDDKIAKLVGTISQHHHPVDQSVAALRKLLRYLQDTVESNEHMRIRRTVVSQDVISAFKTDLVNKYDTDDVAEVTVLKTLGLLSTGSMPTSMTGKPPTLGVNTVIDKQSFIASESSSWSSIAENYGEKLRNMQVGAVIAWLSKAGIPTDLASILASDTPLQTSTSVLLVDTDVEWLPSELQELVEASELANPRDNDPCASLRIAGQRLPMYRFWMGGEVKPCLLFIHSARVTQVPWCYDDGWTFSKSYEVKVCLRVFSQDPDAMNTLLEQSPAWLEQEATTPDQKKAHLEELVWLQGYQQLVLDPGTTPGVFRLDLPTDEPDTLPQPKGESDENIRK